MCHDCKAKPSPFTPQQLLFRNIERLWIGAACVYESGNTMYTITRIDNNRYGVEYRARKKTHYVEFESDRVALAVQRVVSYCFASPMEQAKRRWAWRRAVAAREGA